ncbi:hypothetical protein ACOMHN_033616 [Nucella lapillus]
MESGLQGLSTDAGLTSANWLKIVYDGVPRLSRATNEMGATNVLATE